MAFRFPAGGHAKRMGGTTLMRQADFPMFIVTVRDGDEASGCLVGFVTQCSIVPARYIVCISVENHTYRIARAAESMAVHMVPRDRRDLAALFGGETGDEVDKFSQVPWGSGPRGTVVLEGVGNWFAAAIEGEWAVGDHHAFLVEPLAWSFDAGESPLMYREVAEMAPGHPA